MNYKALGTRIRLRRKSLHMTQAQLAEMADISISFLGHIERGSRKASLETLVALCNVLHITPTALLQDSLLEGSLSGDEVSRQDLVQEISQSVLERLRHWDGGAKEQP